MRRRIWVNESLGREYFAYSLQNGHRSATEHVQAVLMNLDVVHSALISLILLAEAVRWANENLTAADEASRRTLDDFLQSAERDLCIAKATLACEFGFPARCWPSAIPGVTGHAPGSCLATSERDRKHLAIPFLKADLPRNMAPSPNAAKLDPFIFSQHERLLELRDAIIDSIAAAAKNDLRDRGRIGADAASEDLADAGNDAFDRDLALSFLAQECDALADIDDALHRIDAGTYGTCEISGNPIPRERLEAIPFARLTVECQAAVEKQRKVNRIRQALTTASERTRISAEIEDENGAGASAERITVSMARTAAVCSKV